MAYNKERKSLIINADDFGYCSNRNAGIANAFCHGAITSASLLVNAVCSQEAVSLASNYGIPIGLHLNLTEGKPIAQGHRTIIDSNGVFKGKMGFRESLRNGEIDCKEIEAEIKAQLTWFQDNVGSKPTHIDGHQHIHVLPQVTVILAAIMRENEITKTRNPAEDLEECQWIESSRKAFYLSVIQDATTACDIFEKAGICFAAHFIGLSTMGSDMNVKRIQDALKKCFEHKNEIPANTSSLVLHNVCEFMVHPGYRSMHGVGGCGVDPDDFALSQDREHELLVLLNEKLGNFLNKESFQLCSFKDV